MAQNEKVKLYMVLGLAVVAMVVAYFQFFNPKDEEAMVINEPAVVSIKPAVASSKPVAKSMSYKIEPQEEIQQQISGHPGEQKRLFLLTDMRDVFEAPPIPPELKRKAMAEGRDKTVSTKVIPEDIPLTLSGTIVGGSKPMAIINETFVKLGEKIDIFKVVRIEVNKVVLKSGAHERILTVLKPDELLEQ